MNLWALLFQYYCLLACLPPETLVRKRTQRKIPVRAVLSHWEWEITGPIPGLLTSHPRAREPALTWEICVGHWVAR
jgi:hypothetical protein